jgi:uncharacterized protein YjbJ (UPF0337 family)
MNAYRLQGDWNQIKRRIKLKWGALTDDEIRWIDGSSDQLVGLVQMRYGRSIDQANREVREWRNEAGI